MDDPPRRAIDPDHLYGDPDPAPTEPIEPQYEIYRPEPAPEPVVVTEPAQPQFENDVYEQVVDGPAPVRGRDIGDYWPAFVLGGLVLVGLGWWALTNLSGPERGEPVAPAPTTTVTQVDPHLVGPEPESTEPAVEENGAPRPTQTTEPGAPTQQDPQPTETPDIAPVEPPADHDPGEGAPPAETGPTEAPAPQVGLSELPTPPQQVAGYQFDSATADTLTYINEEGAMSVQWAPGLTDADIAGELQGTILVEDWICGDTSGGMACVGAAHDGRIVVSGLDRAEDIVSWGKNLVATWQQQAVA